MTRGIGRGMTPNDRAEPTTVGLTPTLRTGQTVTAVLAATAWRSNVFLTADQVTLDGLGVFWNQWRPELNGTPSATDERYGVHVPATWQDRMTRGSGSRYAS